MEFKGYEVAEAFATAAEKSKHRSLPELEQRALEIMLFIKGSKASIKESTKELEAVLEQIEEHKRG